MIGYYEQTLIEENRKLYSKIDSSVVVEGKVVHPHWHSHMEILVIKQGKAVIQVGANYEEVVEGDMIVIGCHQIHGAYPVMNSSSIITVHNFNIEHCLVDYREIRDGVMSNLLEQLDIVFPIKTTSKHYSYILSLIDRCERLSVLLEKKKEGLTEFYLNQCMIQNCLLELNYYLCSNFVNVNQQKCTALSSKSKGAISNLFDYMEEHYMDALTLEMAANVAGYSNAQLNRLMKKTTGYTFVEYLNRLRVDVALGHMLEGDSITESALKVGFNSISSFNRYFRRYKGMSPRDFMKYNG